MDYPGILHIALDRIHDIGQLVVVLAGARDKNIKWFHARSPAYRALIEASAIFFVLLFPTVLPVSLRIILYGFAPLVFLIAYGIIHSRLPSKAL
jgi:hypothetical protein